MTTPKKLALYLRVSRTKQEFSSQIHALKEFCRRAQWKPGLIFSEKVSGAAAKRTQLDRLRQACRDGHVDTILVYRVDRLGRSALMVDNLLAEFEGMKVRIVGAADQYDSLVRTPATVVLRSVLSGLAESERMTTRERTMAGLKAARARGRRGGRPRESDDKIARAHALRANKPEMSLRAIALEVGLSPAYLSQLFNVTKKKQ